MKLYLQKHFNINLTTAINSEKGVITDTTYPSELGLDLTQFPDAKDTLEKAKKH